MERHRHRCCRRDTLFHIASTATTASASPPPMGFSLPSVLKIRVSKFTCRGVPGTGEMPVPEPPRRTRAALRHSQLFSAASTSVPTTTESLAPPPGVSVAPATGSGGGRRNRGTAGRSAFHDPGSSTADIDARGTGSGTLQASPLAVAVQPQPKPAVGSVESGAGADAPAFCRLPAQPTAGSRPSARPRPLSDLRRGQNWSEPEPRSSGNSSGR